MNTEGKVNQIKIYRAADGVALQESGAMSMPELTPAQVEGFAKLFAPDQDKGEEVKVLVNMPGFHLTYVWFKKEYPLPRHSHDSDCLYYVIAGSLKMGTEELGAGDSFFIPANAAYAYTPGPEGVEVLEFRHKTQFDFNLLAKGEAFWERAANTAQANNEAWQTAKKPSAHH